MHRLLKPTGVLCVHLDYKAVYYIKVEEGYDVSLVTVDDVLRDVG